MRRSQPGPCRDSVATLPDATDTLARLVALPSIAGGDNQDLISEIASALEDAGAQVRIQPGARPGAHLLHAVVGPIDAPGGVLLAAHGDVVDVEGQTWSSDPFTLRVDDARLYGRGATDMKGFIAATLAAIARADKRALRAPLHLAVSHDEELGCAGVAPLLDALAGNPAPLAGVVVGEPTQMRVIDRHKGKAAIDITVRGRAAHSATPSAGVNAVSATAHLIVALEELELRLTDDATDPGFSVPHATIGVGPIAGGVAVNIVPDSCKLMVETRVLPGQALESVTGQISDAAARIAAEMRARAPEASIELERVAAYPPLTPTAASAEFGVKLAAIAGQGNGGAVNFGTEAGMYQERLGVPVVVCGPGSMAQGHTPDEFLSREQLVAAEAFISGLVDSLSTRTGSAPHRTRRLLS